MFAKHCATRLRPSASESATERLDGAVRELLQNCVIRPFDNSQRACEFRYYAKCTGAARSGFGRERLLEQLCPQKMIGVPALLENPPSDYTF